MSFYHPNILNIQNINFNLNLNIQIIKIEFDFKRYIFFYIKISDNQSHIKFYRSIAIIIFMSKQLTIAKFNYNFFFPIFQSQLIMLT